MNRYTCEQVFRLLDQYLDRELDVNEVRRVEEHLANCAQCASEYRLEATLLEGLKERIRRIHVPPSLTQKVELALRAQRVEESLEEDEGSRG